MPNVGYVHHSRLFSLSIVSIALFSTLIHFNCSLSQVMARTTKTLPRCVPHTPSLLPAASTTLRSRLSARVETGEGVVIRQLSPVVLLSSHQQPLIIIQSDRHAQLSLRIRHGYMACRHSHCTILHW